MKRRGRLMAREFKWRRKEEWTCCLKKITTRAEKVYTVVLSTREARSNVCAEETFDEASIAC